MRTPPDQSRIPGPRAKFEPAGGSTRVALCLCGAILALWTAAPSRAQSVRRLVKEGNRQYAAGSFPTALESYGKASVEAPESAVVAFDLGCALFKSGDFAKAREAFERAAIKAPDLPFESRCRYNVGNVDLRLAQRQRDSDPQKAADGYQQAIRHYQDAVRLDPQNADAAHNLEVARVLLKSLLDQRQKDPEGAKECQRKNQDMQKELEQLIKEQEQEAGACDKLSERQKKGDEGGVANEARQLSSDQQGTKGKTADLSRKMEQAQKGKPQEGPSPAEKAREELEAAQKEQGSALDQLGRQDLDQAKGSQDKAADHLKKALEELGGDPQKGTGQSGGEGQDQKKGESQKDEQNKGQQRQEKRSPPGEKNAQARASKGGAKEDGQNPPNERAQDVLREERENKDREMKNVQGGHTPTDKDW
jgi:Ca-activated chloride channel homolog